MIERSLSKPLQDITAQAGYLCLRSRHERELEKMFLRRYTILSHTHSALPESFFFCIAWLFHAWIAPMSCGSQISSLHASVSCYCYLAM